MICVALSIVVAIAGECSPPVVGSVPDPPPPWVLQSVSIAILFSWIQMMLLVGRFPTWGHYALMFSTVLKNVSKVRSCDYLRPVIIIHFFNLYFPQVLVAFVWLIVGFALSFSVLFHGNTQFSSSWRAIVKTVVMMMGEYEYNDLFEPIDDMNKASFVEARNNLSNLVHSSDRHSPNLLSITGRVIFITFVMLASIVLMNLMIGLAVSDIQGLLNEVRGFPTLY